MNFTQLKYVIEVARLKNFTKAAEKLYVTQPTLSIQIRELEKELGHEIFARSKKEVNLTKFGEEFLDFAHETIKKYNEILDKDDEAGYISLGLYWMFGYSGLGETLNAFERDYPNIKMRYLVDGAVTLIDNVIEKKIDAAIITGAYEDESPKLKKLNEIFDMTLIDVSPLVLLANKKSELANKSSITLDELEGKRLMHISRRSNMFEAVDNYFKRNNIKPDFIGYNSQADVCFQLAFYDISYSFCTKETYEHFAQKNEIKALNILPPFNRQLFYIYRKDDSNKALKIFKKYLIDNFNNESAIKNI